MQIGLVLKSLLVSLLALPGAAAQLPDDLEFSHGFAFFDELKYPPDFTHFDYLNPDAPKGGELVLTHPFAFDSLAPSPLGESGAPSGYLLVTDDRETIIFKLRPEARWDDGQPITAHDVAFTFKPDPNDVGANFFFRVFESVEALDDRHVAFHLDGPLTYNHLTMIQYQSILPAHYWRDKDRTAPTMVPPVSSGPYRIADVKAGRYIVYERRPDYWGRDLPLNKGRYNFDTVRYEVYRDGAVLREAFRKGMVDMLDEDDIRHWATAFDGPAAEKGWIRKIRRNYGIHVGMGRALMLNSEVPRLSDRRVRKALTLSFNFNWINEKLYYGQRVRAASFWPGTILVATGLPTEGELALLEPFRDSLPPELFEQPFELPRAGSAAEQRENLLEARNLLAAAGWRVRDGALRNDAGEAFTLEFLTQDPSNARILLPWFKTLERLGIQPSVRLVDISLFTNRIRYHEYEALVQSHDFLMPPTLEVRANFHSTAAGADGSRNYMGVNLPVVDHLIEKAENAYTLEELEAACRALDRVVMWHYYLIPVYAYDERRTVHWDKFGRPPHPLYRPAYPDGWWYDEAKATRIKLGR
jgi:microcin C transport system substrate-binding protein